MEQFAKETLPVSLEEEMRRSYLDYAMSVIVGRALPDVRDGLKPVHRRVLFAMNELGNDWNKAYKKSARVVGDVIGKYHPHGDTAVYDTMVRMAQDFSLRYPLIDGQGNFGSVDGDNAAAMRYTEVRMSKIAHELLADLDKETVDFGPNYDGSEQEPLVLPTKIPNLLINGSSGIAVGMATNIPPHNLTDICTALFALLEDPEIDIESLINIVKVALENVATLRPILRSPSIAARASGNESTLSASCISRARNEASLTPISASALSRARPVICQNSRSDSGTPSSCNKRCW